MKALIYYLMMSFMLMASDALSAQNNDTEYLGLPGDNLNLYAVLNLFQECETLEEFEKQLNDPEQMINNLDLNNDGKVDYIMVMDYSEGNLHNIVLRVATDAFENQDVAVIIVEKQGDGSVIVQIIGDETLYGKDYIIEPNYAETPNPGYRGSAGYSSSSSESTITYHEVSTWPVVVYIYEPYYTAWHSPWYWGFYPSYWHPWKPFFWHFYYGYHYHWWAHYHAHFRPWRYHRCYHCYHNVYYGRIRNNSPTVVMNINQNVYVSTYSKPERRIEGEKFFAERYPNGLSESMNRISKKPGRISESQQQQAKPTKGFDTAKPAVQSELSLKRPIQTSNPLQTSRETDNKQGLDNAKLPQKEPMVQKRPASKPQETSTVPSVSRVRNSRDSGSRPSVGSGSSGSGSSGGFGSSSGKQSMSSGSSSSRPASSSSSSGSKPSSSSGSSSSFRPSSSGSSSSGSKSSGNTNSSTSNSKSGDSTFKNR